MSSIWWTALVVILAAGAVLGTTAWQTINGRPIGRKRK